MSRHVIHSVSRVLALSMLLASLVPVLQHVCAEESHRATECDHTVPVSEAARADFEKAQSDLAMHRGSDDEPVCCLIDAAIDVEQQAVVASSQPNGSLLPATVPVVFLAVDPVVTDVRLISIENTGGNPQKVRVHLSNAVILS